MPKSFYLRFIIFPMGITVKRRRFLFHIKIRRFFIKLVVQYIIINNNIFLHFHAKNAYSNFTIMI